MDPSNTLLMTFRARVVMCDHRIDLLSEFKGWNKMADHWSSATPAAMDEGNGKRKQDECSGLFADNLSTAPSSLRKKDWKRAPYVAHRNQGTRNQTQSPLTIPIIIQLGHQDT